MIFFFCLLQTYKLWYFIREKLVLSLFKAGFSFLLSVNSYDCFLDMALVLSPNCNRESEQSKSYTLNSIGGEHESCLPYTSRIKEKWPRNDRGQLVSVYFSEMSVYFRCRLREGLHIPYYTSGNSLLLEIIYVSLVYHNSRMSDFFFI